MLPLKNLTNAITVAIFAKYHVSGHGGIGRRAGLRSRWETVEVQVLLSAPRKLAGFRKLRSVIFMLKNRKCSKYVPMNSTNLKKPMFQGIGEANHKS